MAFTRGPRLRHVCFHAYFILLAAIVSSSTIASAQTFQWIRQFGSPGNEEVKGVAAGTSGIYVVGSTDSRLEGQRSAGRRDAFVRAYSPDGNLLWTRQFGTEGDDAAGGVTSDATSLYVVGRTEETLAGQPPRVATFVRKYDFEGSVQWARQFSSPGGIVPFGVAVDSTGVYVAGIIGSDPSVAGISDAFVRRFYLDGNAHWTRQFGSPLGDVAFDVSADPSGVYVAGTTEGVLPGQTGSGSEDGFVRKYTPDGSEVWTRQFGSAGNDGVGGIGVTDTGVYVVGATAVALPEQTNLGGTDTFTRKYDLRGNEQWTRQFGSSGYDSGGGLAADPTGVYVVGITTGTLPGQTFAGGSSDAYVRRYDNNGDVVGTLQFGSNSADEAFSVATSTSSVYLVGNTLGALPGQLGAGGADSFLARFSAVSPPVINQGGVVNNASFAPSPSPIAPGSIAAIFGNNLNDGSSVLYSSFGLDGKLVTSLGGSSVTVNGIPAPLFYSTPRQLGIQIPVELTGQTSATVQAKVNGQTSLVLTVFLNAATPGIFTVNQQGFGPAAVLHEDNVTPVTAQSPARPGEVVVLYATGLGALFPALGTGQPSTGNQTVEMPTALIDGIPGEILFNGAAPGFVGLNQINVRIPLTTRPALDVPVVINTGGSTSNTVTIAIQ